MLLQVLVLQAQRGLASAHLGGRIVLEHAKAQREGGIVGCGIHGGYDNEARVERGRRRLGEDGMGQSKVDEQAQLKDLVGRVALVIETGQRARKYARQKEHGGGGLGCAQGRRRGR